MYTSDKFMCGVLTALCVFDGQLNVHSHGACLVCHECLITQMHTTNPHATKKIHASLYTYAHIKRVCAHMCKFKLNCTVVTYITCIFK